MAVTSDGTRSLLRIPRVAMALAALISVAIALPFIGSSGQRGTGDGQRPTAPARSQTGAVGQPSTQVRLTGLAPDAVIHVAGAALVNSAGQPVRLLGVDATGTEDACIEDRGFSWGPFDLSEAGSIAAWHVNAVRVPLNEDCWLGINGAPARYSGAAYQAAIEGWVAELNSVGLIAILDLHWSAPGIIVANRQWPMPDATHSVTFWSQVANAFKADQMVLFDLFNEPSLGGKRPSATDWSCWLSGCKATTQGCPTTVSAPCSNLTYQVAGMQQLVNAVRSAGADQPLMLGGLGWASTPCNHGKGGTCEWLQHEPVDPLHQLVVSFHVYYDHSDCDTVTCWNTTVAPLAATVPVVTSELGEKTCTATFDAQYMQWADAHGVSYLLWAWQPASTVATLACGPQRLLSSWSGAPNALNPVGPLLLRHLAPGLAPQF